MTVDNSFGILVSMLLVLALVVAVVGGIGLMGSLWISVIERIKEIGIMRAVGARSPALVRMFLMEGLVQGLLSWLIAVPLAILADAFALRVRLGQTMFDTELTFRFNYNAMLIWLAVVLTRLDPGFDHTGFERGPHQRAPELEL